MSEQPNSRTTSEPPEYMPRKNSSVLSFLGKVLSRCSRWQLVGNIANEPKLILALAPHNSNWDFFVGVPLMFSMDARLSVFMKQEAFFWPFRRFLKYIGFVPINRQAAGGIVDNAVHEFKQRDTFWLLLTPEGTRKKVSQWKNGFLRIAQQADVPIQLVSLDYANKQCCFGPVIRASGNIEKDLDFCTRATEKYQLNREN